MKTILIVGLATVFQALAQAPDDPVLRARQHDALDAQALILATASLSRAAAVTNAPYSADAVTETTQVLGDGNRIVRRTTQKLYRDSDGRERREESVLAVGALAQADAPRVITISDPIEKVSYTLDPQKHVAQRGGVITRRAGDQSSLRTPEPIGTQPVKEDLGSRNIEGVIAHGTRITETIPAGQIGNQFPIKIIDEVWHSSELRLDVMTTHSDPRSGEAVYKLTNISRVNPPRALFELPADYTISGPTAGGRGGRGSTPGVQK